MRVNLKTIVTAGDMSQSTITSLNGEIEQAFGYSVQAVWTGSPVGSIKLQASLDGSTFIDVADSSQAVSSAGSFLWNVSEVMYPIVRVLYTKDSGTGSLTVKFFYRGF